MPVGPTNTKAQKQKVVHQEMHKFKEGSLHSGSKSGPKVTSRAQAIAIALSESGQSNKTHGYGHTAPQRRGSTRLSGHPSAHRVGKR